MQTQTPPGLSSKSKTQHPKKAAQQIARQILQEPFEIAKTAASQIAGSEQQANAPQSQSQQQGIEAPLSQEDAVKKQRKDSSHIQAFQQELQEIKQIQAQREQERQQMRLQEEQAKKQKEEQKEQAQSTPLQIIGKVKRGILGGGKMGHVQKKQRSAELVKTPSN